MEYDQTRKEEMRMTDLTPLTREALSAASRHAIRASERARNQAKRRDEELRRQARRHLQLRDYSLLPWYLRAFRSVDSMPVDERLVDVVTNVWTSGDPTWKGAVGVNQWQLQQATSYGAAAQVTEPSDAAVPHPRAVRR